jgi:Raf kinase inhibitor-like YbhB/YbcL family protein
MTRRHFAGRIAVTRGPALAAHLILVLDLLAAPGCWHGEPVPAEDPSRLTIALRSRAFSDGAMIPKEYTCDGADRSPPLEWSGVPQSAQELALICDDPDAPMGTWSHWVIVHLPPGVKGLKEGAPAETDLPVSAMQTHDDIPPNDRAIQGKNDFGKFGFGGPCPPSGTHRYVFRLYALDRRIELGTSPPTRSDVLKAIRGHILAEGRLVGKYARGG